MYEKTTVIIFANDLVCKGNTKKWITEIFFSKSCFFFSENCKFHNYLLSLPLFLRIFNNQNAMVIGVFCSACQQLDNDFFQLTEEFGRWAASQGHSIVYGGVGLGLMETLARAVSQAGGRTIGVVPRIAASRGSSYTQVEIPCDNLSDRKQIMQDQSDAFVAMPGGIGTLDEIFTVAASATIGYHHRPVILYNMKGFWQPLLRMLDDLQATGVIRSQWTDYIRVASTLEEVARLLDA